MRLLHLKLMKFWIVVLLFFIPSHSFAQRWRYCLLVAPESYPLRWGEREPPDADMVAMPPGLDTSRTIPTSPGCYKVGKSGFWLSYSVEDAGLVGGLFVVVWDEITGETVWQRYYYPVWREGVVSLDGLVLPSYITVLGFQVVWLGYGSMFTRFTVFVVLDEPKAPMNPAWVSVLRISCQWARGIATAEAAAKVLTENLYLNGIIINPGAWPNMQFIRNATDDGEIFYLRKFIENGFYGYSSDFADFLVCLVTSVGAYEMKVQRTYSLNVIYTLSATDPDKGGWTILTNLIDPAGALQSANHYEFPYTQFAIVGSDVWDGSLAIVIEGHTNLPIKWARDSKYKPDLVQFFRYYENHTLVLQKFPGEEGEPWNPTPANGFVPQVTAADLLEG